MQLSRLEVKGFKSFGDKITINFDNGITGIVGPNGCGKSNVVDAIRWVLGEQKTRNLRSEKMEDVIFNGTKDRKPHQMAEVSITFNNTRNLLPTEYSQVTVTRRYFRSGESDYELNGVGCRLKDINNLFLDTGIGSDSYAIIELKMVEDLLNDREGSRRELFEEAAGVSKFKIRKKQTLRKLEDTDKDLSRVSDLLFEIEKNLKSLEKQAKQAEKYYELKQEYKTHSISLARVMMANVLKETAEMQQSADTENDRKTSLISSIAQAEAETERIKVEILQKETELKQAQRTLNEHIGKIRNYESENKIKNERLKYLTDTQERLIRQLQTDKELKDKSEILIRSIGQELESLTKQFLEVESRVEKLKAEAEDQKNKASKAQQYLSEYTTKYQSKQKLVYDLNKALELNQFQVSSLKQELEKTASDSNTQSSEVASFDDKINALAYLINQKETELLSLEQIEKENAAALVLLENEIAQLKDKIAEANRKADARQNEYSLTKSLVDNLEGFPEAVRFLKKNANWVKDVPLLSDILTCDEKYRVAIENYLEPFMNFYIVDTDQEAVRAVNLLSDASMGKANFFVLSTFAKLKSPDVLSITSATPAMSLIEYDEKYIKLIEYLLGGIYLVEESVLPTIINTDGAVFITSNGKMIWRQHSISGGSVGLFEGKRIGRAKNLEILEKDIQRLLGLLSQLKSNLDGKQQAAEQLKSKSQKAAIEHLQKEYNALTQEHIAYSTKKEQLSGILQKNTGRKEEILEKIAALSEEIKNHLPMTKEAQEDLKNLEELILQYKEESEEETRLSNLKNAAYNEQNLLYYQQKNKVDSLQQDLEYKESNLEATRLRIVQSTAELAKVEEDTKQILSKAEVNDEELTSLYENKTVLEIELNEIEKSYYATRGQADVLDKQIKELQRQKENADLVLQELNSKLNEGKLLLSAYKERLSLEFNTDLDEIAKQPGDEQRTESELRSLIDHLKNGMERIGQINPMAMEAYQEIKERYDLIHQQRADINDAKASLLSTIAEIDTTARAQFQESFLRIRENFVKVFRSLFTEDDNCDLLLADPSDPLESDIDILAKPKGKRPQTINQLSGGEKTLTAVALLFAIYLIKPAPFCIFDEVDAPLDDANIDKFNNIIKKFSAESQFIIVTHNKRTMASTDIIYGVTMIETGISRVVPVDLRSLEV